MSVRPRGCESFRDTGAGKLGTLESNQRGPEGGGIRQSQEDPPQLPQQSSVDPAGGGVQWGLFRKQDSMPGVGPDNELPQPGSCARRRCTPEGVSFAAAPRSSTTPCSCPGLSTSRPTCAGGSALWGRRKIPCGADGNPRLGPFSGRYFSQEATGDWDSLGGFFSLMVHDTMFLFVF